MLKHYEKIEGNKELKFSVYTEKAGYSYLTNTPQKTGIKISISPVEVSKTDNFVMETVSAFSGIQFYVMESARKNAKKENTVFCAVKAEAPELTKIFINNVLIHEKNTDEYSNALQLFASVAIDKIKKSINPEV